MKHDTEKRRLFFAILLPDDIKHAIGEVVSRLNQSAPRNTIRWCREDQWHFTLKFLGELTPHQSVKATEGAEKTARIAAPFSLKLNGVGAFPNPQRPTVMWLGVSEGSQQMSDLANQLDAELQAMGFPKDNRAFKPHLTLARIKSYEQEKESAKLLQNPTIAEFDSVVISSFALMRSYLLPDGAKYEVTEIFNLKG
jgi:2'-5' RNA ligase